MADGLREEEADSSGLLVVAVPRRQTSQSDCLCSATPSLSQRSGGPRSELAPCSCWPPFSPGCNGPSNRHIICRQYTSHPCTCNTPPPHRGEPPCVSPVTLPGTGQVVGAERARECQPSAKGSLPFGTQLTGALPQCRAQCTHEDNRPAHMRVSMHL